MQLKIENGNSSKNYRSAYYLHGISANANVGDVLTFACRAHKNFTRTLDFDTLSDQHLFVAFGNAISYHPTRGTAGGGSRRRIFTTVKNHACSSSKPTITPFRTEKIEEAGTCALQELGCLG